MRIIPRKISALDKKDVEISTTLEKIAEQPSLQQDKKSQLKKQKPNEKKDNKTIVSKKDQVEKNIEKEFKNSLFDNLLEEQITLDD